MRFVPRLCKRQASSRWPPVLIALIATTAAADHPPPFTPFSPPSASQPGPISHTGGEDIYRAICQACHMPDGLGAQGAGHYPALAANRRLASSAFAAARVLAGRSGMPRFADMLSDAQVADVVNYVRTHFGNRYADRLTAAEVESLRVAMNEIDKP